MKYLVIAALVAGALLACSSFTTSPEAVADAGAPDGGDGGAAAGPDTGAPDGMDAGDGVTTLLATPLPMIAGISVFGDYVYFAEDGAGSIRRVNTNGGSADTVATTGGAPKNPVANANAVYWCDIITGQSYVVALSMTAGAGVVKWPIPNGGICHGVALTAAGNVVATYTHADTAQGALAYLDASLANASLAESQDNPFLVATGATDVFWTGSATGVVNSIKQIDGYARGAVLNVTQDAQGQIDCESIATSGSDVFWAQPHTSSDGSTGRVAGLLVGGAPTFVVEGEPLPRSIAADSDHVYWRNADGAIRRAPVIAGGNAETFARTAPGDLIDYFQSLALSSNEVFWVTFDGLLQKHTK